MSCCTTADSGQDDAASKIDEAGMRSYEGANFGISSHGHYGVAADCKRLHDAVVGIHRVYPTWSRTRSAGGSAGAARRVAGAELTAGGACESCEVDVELQGQRASPTRAGGGALRRKAWAVRDFNSRQ